MRISDWSSDVCSSDLRDGTRAESVAIEARNLAPLPGDVDFTVAASLPISGLTAWQGLFEHGRLQAGRSVLVHGAAGAVGSMVTQLAGEAGAYVIGTRLEEHKSELPSLMRLQNAVFCLKKKTKHQKSI